MPGKKGIKQAICNQYGLTCASCSLPQPAITTPKRQPQPATNCLPAPHLFSLCHLPERARNPNKCSVYLYWIWPSSFRTSSQQHFYFIHYHLLYIKLSYFFLKGKLCYSAQADSLDEMLLGRFLVGIGIGVNTVLVPIYISEVIGFYYFVTGHRCYMLSNLWIFS